MFPVKTGQCTKPFKLLFCFPSTILIFSSIYFPGTASDLLSEQAGAPEAISQYQETASLCSQ
jgi:hypothetical protein